MTVRGLSDFISLSQLVPFTGVFFPKISFSKEEIPELLGRVTSDWRRCFIVAALAVDVIFIAVTFFSGSSIITVGGLVFIGFGHLFGAKYIWKYQTLKSLQGITESLEHENHKLRSTRKRLGKEVDRLSEQNQFYHNENLQFSYSNQVLRDNNLIFIQSNQILQQNNETFSQSNKTLKEQIQELNAFTVRIKEALSKENAAFAASVQNLNLSVDTFDERFKDDLKQLEGAIGAFNDEKRELSTKLDQVHASLNELLKQEFFSHFSQESRELSTKIDQVNETFRELLDDKIYGQKIKDLTDATKEIITIYNKQASIQTKHLRKLERLKGDYKATQKAQETAQTQLEELIKQIKQLKMQEEELHAKNVELQTKFEGVHSKIEGAVDSLSHEVDRLTEVPVDS